MPSPERLPSLRREGLSRPAGAGARAPVIVARSLLRHRVFSLAGLPEADRIGALQAQLLAWQPFVDALVLVDLHGDQAQAYALPSVVVQEAGLKPEALWPESLCHEAQPDGLHLLRCLEGVEGQCWQGGALLASRWWAAAPEASEWQAFARQSRAHVALGAQAVPAAQSLPWQRPLRLPRPAAQLGRAAAGKERLLVGAGALVLLVFSSMTARTAWDAYQSREQAQAAVAQLRQDVAPLLAARDKALAAADQSAGLLAQLQAPQPLDVLEELGRLLPKGSTVKEFDLNQLTVRVALELPADVSRAKVITELESGAWFTQVSEVKDGVARSGINLEMKLAAAQPPARKSGQAADAGLSRGAADLPAPPPGVDVQIPTAMPAGAKKS